MTKPFITPLASIEAGDSFEAEADGFTFQATVWHDAHSGPPWKEDEGHGPVSEWTQERAVSGECLLWADARNNRFLYYDFDAACQLARTGQWRTPGDEDLSPEQRAIKAAAADFTTLRAWCNDEWCYVGVSVTVSRYGIMLTKPYDNALWGVDCGHPQGDPDYIREVANQLADDALFDARTALCILCNCDRKDVP